MNSQRSSRAERSRPPRQSFVSSVRILLQHFWRTSAIRKHDARSSPCGQLASKLMVASQQSAVLQREVQNVIVTIIVTVAPKQQRRTLRSGVLTSLESFGADERT